MLIALIYFPFILILRDDTNNDNDHQLDKDKLNKGKLNKELKWLTKAFNGEEKKDRQLFFINKNDVTDVKLAYELLSAKEAIETNNITKGYNSISLDNRDNYYEYQITSNNTLEFHDDIAEGSALYDEYKIEKLHETFMKESNFDEGDLVAYYRAIIEFKKIDKKEVKKIADTYFKMVTQFARLKSISRSETVNDAIDKIHATQGFSQSQLRRELDEL